MDVIKNESKSQPGHGWENSNALSEPLLPVAQPDPMETGPVLRAKDGITRNLPRSVAELVGMDKDLWEKLMKPAYMREFTDEWDRMLSSFCSHEEQRSAHNQIGKRMSNRFRWITGLHLLLVGVFYYAFTAGYDGGRLGSQLMFVRGAEIGWYITEIILRVREIYHHIKQEPGEFWFKLNFQNLPALKELAGEQKWKEMQECSDDVRVLEDLNGIVSSAVNQWSSLRRMV